MEYLNGGDLFSLLKTMGCLDENVTRMYIAELVSCVHRTFFTLLFDMLFDLFTSQYKNLY